MPYEFAGETTQSHRNRSAGIPVNVPWSTVKWVCNLDGRVVIERVQASISDDSEPSRIGVVASPARGERERRMKWGNFELGPDIMIEHDNIHSSASPRLARLGHTLANVVVLICFRWNIKFHVSAT